MKNENDIELEQGMKKVLDELKIAPVKSVRDVQKLARDNGFTLYRVDKFFIHDTVNQFNLQELIYKAYIVVEDDTDAIISIGQLDSIVDMYTELVRKIIDIQNGTFLTIGYFNHMYSTGPSCPPPERLT